MFLQEELFKFPFEVGRQDALAHGITDFLDCPETASVEFIFRRLDESVVGGAIHLTRLLSLCAHYSSEGLFW